MSENYVMIVEIFDTVPSRICFTFQISNFVDLKKNNNREILRSNI